jgi:hypothetical protein
LVESEERIQLPVEGEQSELIARRSISDERIGLAARIGPKVCPTHAGAGIDQKQDTFSSRTHRRWHGLFKEWPSETESEQTNDSAAEQKQEQVLDAVTLGQAWRRRPKENERAKNLSFASRATDKVKDNGQAHRQSSEQK